MGVLMCEACAATTPELPPSAFHAAGPVYEDRELTADEVLCAASEADGDVDGADAAMDDRDRGYAGPVEDYMHQPYLTRRAWSVPCASPASSHPQTTVTISRGVITTTT